MYSSVHKPAIFLQISALESLTVNSYDSPVTAYRRAIVMQALPCSVGGADIPVRHEPMYSSVHNYSISPQFPRFKILTVNSYPRM